MACSSWSDPFCPSFPTFPACSADTIAGSMHPYPALHDVASCFPGPDEPADALGSSAWLSLSTPAADAPWAAAPAPWAAAALQSAPGLPRPNPLICGYG
jgi:hypothetical protein